MKLPISDNLNKSRFGLNALGPEVERLRLRVMAVTALIECDGVEAGRVAERGGLIISRRLQSEGETALAFLGGSQP
jgi:hypothetical protein